jgi:hypothetical protein
MVRYYMKDHYTAADTDCRAVSAPLGRPQSAPALATNSQKIHFSQRTEPSNPYLSVL